MRHLARMLRDGDPARRANQVYANQKQSGFVNPFGGKYSSSVFRKIVFLCARPASFEEGRTRRHDREAGCDGRACAIRRRAQACTAKACGPGTPGLVLSLAVMIREMTVTKRSWTPGRARRSR